MERCLISSSDDLPGAQQGALVSCRHAPKAGAGKAGPGKASLRQAGSAALGTSAVHVGQVADYLLNVLSNFCSTNFAHAAIAVLPAVNCRLAR